jgi:putative nucleotidyltransferase with HDIG domain
MPVAGTWSRACFLPAVLKGEMRIILFQEALDNRIGARWEMSAVRLKRIQQFIRRMPSLSTTVAKVLEICNNPAASANDLNRVISYDPVLTAQVLKLINSAFYGLPNRIPSLVRAIIMLGINTVKNLVLASSVLAACKGLSHTEEMTINDFWAHSLCVGVLSKIIATARNVPVGEREEYFVAGLLHDLGKLPLMACFPEEYGRAISASKDAGRPLVEAENENIGINHCQVGVLIAGKWNLGISMQDAIMKHHMPATNEHTDFMVKCIGTANLLANHFQIGSAGDFSVHPVLLKNCLEGTGLSMEALTELKLKMEGEIEKASVFLQIADMGAQS